MPHSLESPFATDQFALRGRNANGKRTQPEGEYVLYWMQSTQRFEENWALRFAVREADRLGKPLLIHQGLDPTYPHASDRIHHFVLRNAVELATRALRIGLRYRFVLRRRRADDRRAVDRLAERASLVVTDLFPTGGVAERTARFADRVNCRVVEIDSHAVVPSGTFEREEYAARTIRPKLLKLLDHALEPVQDRVPCRELPESVAASLEGDALPLLAPGFSIDAEVARCEIDHAVSPAPLPSGRRAARARLRAFCDAGLAGYAERRADPNDEVGSSRLSPYLHFGQIAAAEVVRAVRAQGSGEDVAAFLDQVIVWRELALNFCLRNPHYASLEALPAWVHRTMRAHALDRRDPDYSLDTLERGATGEPLWNAAQHELRRSGMMHNFVRMLWGKSVLRWAPRYADALAWLVHLNDKYALDGRDPNGYAGIQWCFGKFDRPFAERPLFGTIRPMSLARARGRFDVDRYVARWSGAVS